MMKIKYLMASLFIISPLAQADLGAINLKLSATIVSNTCVVRASSTNQTVNLGTWASRQFYAGVEPVTTPVPFTIFLDKCGPAARSVEVRFSGVKDNVDNSLFALNGASTATKVAIAILDKTQGKMLPEVWGKPELLSANADSVPLVFYAQYVATGSSVTPGSANSQATFELRYE